MTGSKADRPGGAWAYHERQYEPAYFASKYGLSLDESRDLLRAAGHSREKADQLAQDLGRTEPAQAAAVPSELAITDDRISGWVRDTLIAHDLVNWIESQRALIAELKSAGRDVTKAERALKAVTDVYTGRLAQHILSALAGRKGSKGPDLV